MTWWGVSVSSACSRATCLFVFSVQLAGQHVLLSSVFSRQGNLSCCLQCSASKATCPAVFSVQPAEQLVLLSSVFSQQSYFSCCLQCLAGRAICSAVFSVQLAGQHILLSAGRATCLAVLSVQLAGQHVLLSLVFSQQGNMSCCLQCSGGRATCPAVFSVQLAGLAHRQTLDILDILYNHPVQGTRLSVWFFSLSRRAGLVLTELGWVHCHSVWMMSWLVRWHCQCNSLSQCLNDELVSQVTLSVQFTVTVPEWWVGWSGDIVSAIHCHSAWMMSWLVRWPCYCRSLSQCLNDELVSQMTLLLQVTVTVPEWWVG